MKKNLRLSEQSSEASVNAVTEQIRRTFLASADSFFLENLQSDLRDAGIVDAIRDKNSTRLYRWLVSTLSYQGISDRVAAQFIQNNGEIRAGTVKSSLKHSTCEKLKSFWHFESCNYRKERYSCSKMDLFKSCGLPRFPLRNGRLNQTAFSLYLFIRDIAEGDLIGWIDKCLAFPSRDVGAELRHAMRGIFGVSDKISSMLLSSILLSGASDNARWGEVGGEFIVVDTLVHNHLHRTGVLKRLGFDHPYGAGCYGGKGCAEAIRLAAEYIDASVFNPSYPRYFPRFVQHALWRFCAQDELGVCNGNRIDDRQRCANRVCVQFELCSRTKLQIAEPLKNIRNQG